ncbi:MAG: ParB/RepB/Spo0J family partition protein [Aeromicrobium sp.]|nr:ParB/RepB/Spo0J family partition protein [Burkholderiales bacterium]
MTATKPEAIVNNKPPAATRKQVKFSGLVKAGLIAPVVDPAEKPQFGNSLSSVDDSTEPSDFKFTTPASAAVERMIPIELLDDSPYQFRRGYDPVHLDELSASLNDAGQRSPITVRPGKIPGRFELIKGHSRKYSALNIGWTELRGLVVHRDDRQAKLDCMLDNENAKLKEYEYGLMYKDAMEDNFAKTQVEVARLFVCSQAKVSNCLAMLDLPVEVLKMLDKDAGLLGAKAAKVVMALWKEHPTHHALILEAIERIKDGADQGSIKGWVAQKITFQQQQQQKPSGSVRHIITSKAGVSRYVTVAKDRDINVRLTDPSLNRDDVHKRIDELLRTMESEAKAE